MRKNNYSTEFVQYMPEELEEGVLYIAPHFECALHKCMCGCGEIVCTPLSKNQWNWKFDGISASISTSVGNYSFQCKSHYFLSDGIVRWVNK